MPRRSSAALQFARFALVLLGGLAIGCGSGDKGNRVSGKVTFKGQPVPIGKIYIKPDGSKGNSGQTGFASITNGTYDTGANGGQGAVSGAVIFEIEGIDPTPPPGAGPDVGATSLFSGYTKPVELKPGTSVQDIDVPEEAAKGPVQPPSSPVVVP